MKYHSSYPFNFPRAAAQKYAFKYAGSFYIIQQHHKLPFNEFIAMMAMMMSIAALSIDTTLPALDVIGHSFGIMNANDNQAIIGWLFFGMAFGQLLFGPLSDAIGRRMSMLIGFSVFFAGSLLSLLANDFDTLLVSRFLQGLGAAAPRVLTTAIVRDLYSGREMARVMSFILMIFIAVPMLAPLMGLGILIISNWQSIFILVGIIALLSLTWYLMRQGETLDPSNRKAFTVQHASAALITILNNRRAIGYCLASGIIFGPFVFYLSSSQQLFQITYALGQWFPVYFAGLSFTFGLSSFVNGRLVVKLGMRRMVRFALLLMSISSVLFMLVATLFNGLPPLWISTIYMVIIFFSVGLKFGNLNALAMEPLGAIAGIGAAIIGFLSTLLASSIALIAGAYFNGTMYPLVICFSLAGIVSLMLMRWIEHK